MNGEGSNESIFSLFARYLRDGVVCFLVPVATIHRASDRDLSYPQIAAILFGFAVLAFAAAYLPTLAQQNIQVSGSDDLLSQLQAFDGHLELVGALLSPLLLFVLLASLVILYFLTKLLGGAGTLRGFLSAALVLVAVWFVGQVIQSVLLLVPETANGPEPGISLIRLVVPVILGLILISYSVLLARFGGRLDWPRSFISVAILFGISVMEVYLLDESLFGGLMDVGQLARG